MDPEIQDGRYFVDTTGELCQVVEAMPYVIFFRDGIDRDQVSEERMATVPAFAALVGRWLDKDPQCRCGHKKSSQESSALGGAQCRVCPDDGEGMWRHAFTPSEE